MIAMLKPNSSPSLPMRRHGRWQRRWFVVAPGEQRLYYFKGPEQAPARATIPLRGASLVTDVLPLASSVKALKALQSGGLDSPVNY